MIKSFFAIVVLALIFPVNLHAQEISPSLSQTPKPVEYILPYPGMLPDNPLYFLKVLRDTAQHFLVSNPLKKSEFYLLQADKSVNASAMLAQKKRTVVLAGATANESQRYFESAVDEAVAAKKQGLDIHDITKRMVLANDKHQETLKQLAAQADKAQRAPFVTAGQTAKIIEKKVKALLPAK